MFWSFAAIALAIAWGGVALNDALKEWRPWLVITTMPVPKPFLISKNSWHDAFCQVLPGHACTVCPIIPITQDEMDKKVERRFQDAVRQRTRQLIARSPHFKMVVDQWHKVDFSCCYADELYRWGYLVAESTDYIITWELNPDYSDPKQWNEFRLSAINRKHCLAPPMRPFGDIVFQGARSTCTWPDHNHFWLDYVHIRNVEVPENGVGVWDRSEKPWRPDVTYNLLRIPRKLINPLPVYLFDEEALDLADNLVGLTSPMKKRIDLGKKTDARFKVMSDAVEALSDKLSSLAKSVESVTQSIAANSGDTITLQDVVMPNLADMNAAINSIKLQQTQLDEKQQLQIERLDNLDIQTAELVSANEADKVIIDNIERKLQSGEFLSSLENFVDTWLSTHNVSTVVKDTTNYEDLKARIKKVEIDVNDIDTSMRILESTIQQIVDLKSSGVVEFFSHQGHLITLRQLVKNESDYVLFPFDNRIKEGLSIVIENVLGPKLEQKAGAHEFNLLANSFETFRKQSGALSPDVTDLIGTVNALQTKVSMLDVRGPIAILHDEAGRYSDRTLYLSMADMHSAGFLANTSRYITIDDSAENNPTDYVLRPATLEAYIGPRIREFNAQVEGKFEALLKNIDQRVAALCQSTVTPILKAADDRFIAKSSLIRIGELTPTLINQEAWKNRSAESVISKATFDAALDMLLQQNSATYNRVPFDLSRVALSLSRSVIRELISNSGAVAANFVLSAEQTPSALTYRIIAPDFTYSPKRLLSSGPWEELFKTLRVCITRYANNRILIAYNSGENTTLHEVIYGKYKDMRMV